MILFTAAAVLAMADLPPHGASAEQLAEAFAEAGVAASKRELARAEFFAGLYSHWVGQDTASAVRLLGAKDWRERAAKEWRAAFGAEPDAAELFQLSRQWSPAEGFLYLRRAGAARKRQGVARLSGVVAKPDGQPAGRAWVCVDPHSGSPALAQADADGHYEVVITANERHSLPYPFADGFGTALDRPGTAAWPAGAAKLDLRLAEAKPIAGEVVDEAGQPIANASVSYGLTVQEGYVPYLSVATDARGKFQLRGPNASGWPSNGQVSDVIVQHAGHLMARPEPPGKGLWRIVLRRGRTIAGRVLRPDGTPEPFARVRFLQDLPEATLADAAGRYRFDNAPPKEVRLRAVGETFAKAETTVSDAQATRDLKLAEAGWIEGLALANDLPAADARIESGDAVALADADGKFRLGPLPAGRSVELRAQAWLRPDQPVFGKGTFAVGAADAVLRLAPRPER